MPELIQPSGDAKATALTLAVQICQPAGYDEKGIPLKGDPKKLVMDQAAIIADVARMLYAAVRDERP